MTTKKFYEEEEILWWLADMYLRFRDSLILINYINIRAPSGICIAMSNSR